MKAAVHLEVDNYCWHVKVVDQAEGRILLRFLLSPSFNATDMVFSKAGGCLC